MSKSIFLAIPAYGGSIKTGCVNSLLDLAIELTKTGIKFDRATVDRADIESARNQLASYFLTQTDFSHLLFTDSDMTFSPSTVLKMLNMEQPFVGCVYPRRSPDGQFVVWLDKSEGFRGHGDVGHFDGIGVGLCLIHRDVFKKLAERGDLRTETTSHETIFGFFDKIRDGDKIISEDLSFCRRWRNAGGIINGLIDEDIGHIGEFTYKASFMDAMKSGKL